MQDEIIIPKMFLNEVQEPVGKKIEKVYNPKTIKQSARENMKINEKKKKYRISFKKINPFAFRNETLKLGFRHNVDSHNVNHANSILATMPIYADVWIEEKRFVIEKLKEMANINAILRNHYKFKNRPFFSACSTKIDEEGQRCDEFEKCNKLNFNQNLAESDTINIVKNLNQNIRFKFKKQKIRVGYLIKLVQWE